VDVAINNLARNASRIPGNDFVPLLKTFHVCLATDALKQKKAEF
jgi:hypothetical protein